MLYYTNHGSIIRSNAEGVKTHFTLLHMCTADIVSIIGRSWANSLDSIVQTCAPGMCSADVMLQGSQSAQHVVLALDGWVAGARAGADAQLKLAEA